MYAEELGRQEPDARRGEQLNGERTASVLRQQQEAIRALSTPIIQAWEGVLVLPIIGALDSVRAITDIMEKLLGEIVRTKAHFAVLDPTGVEDEHADGRPPVPGGPGRGLLSSRCLVSGISPGSRRPS